MELLSPNEFCEQIPALFENKLGEELRNDSYQVFTEERMKDDKKILGIGLRFTDPEIDSSHLPFINLGEIYKKIYKVNKDITVAAAIISNEYEKKFWSEIVKPENVIFTLVNPQNDTLKLDQIPNYKVSDMNLVFSIVLRQENQAFYTCSVTDHILELTNIKKESILEMAMDTTQKMLPAKITELEGLEENEKVFEISNDFLEASNNTLLYQKTVLAKLAEEHNSNLILIADKNEIIALLETDCNESKVFDLNEVKEALKDETAEVGQVYYYSKDIQRLFDSNMSPVFSFTRINEKSQSK